MHAVDVAGTPTAAPASAAWPRSALDAAIESATAAVGGVPDPIASAAVAVAAYYLVGVAVLAIWPEFSRTVTRTIVRRPVRAALSGLVLMLVVSALAVAAFAVLWIAGPFLVFAFVWLPIAMLAVVYVSLAVIGGVLSLLGVDRPYLALALGGVAPAAIALAPRDAVVDLLFLGVLTLGGGAMLWSLWHRRRRARTS